MKRAALKHCKMTAQTCKVLLVATSEYQIPGEEDVLSTSVSTPLFCCHLQSFQGKSGQGFVDLLQVEFLLFFFVNFMVFQLEIFCLVI